MDVQPDSGLPASIEASWGRRTPPRKGPKPGLSIERIVGAAIVVADAEGLAAVSMSRVASELGTSAMSLYRYVGAKDELIALMVDAAIGTLSAPAAAEGWRDGLSRWAWDYLAALRRHPWVLRVPVGAPPVTPNLTAALEDGLASLAGTGLSEPEKLSTMLLLSGYVRNVATVLDGIVEMAAAAGKAGRVMPSWGETLRRMTDPASFPALHAALGSGAFDQDDGPDDEFVFGLARVLDGVEALVVERS
ncbi:MAG TPA: TetR/AcrR family transcriptional regulator [Gaiellales bacterium]|jgi:AcrR family transcriptional regulator